MANLTSPDPRDPQAAEDRNAVIAGATRIFREVGVTAGDLRPWASWCPALGELADAMDADTVTGTATVGLPAVRSLPPNESGPLRCANTAAGLEPLAEPPGRNPQ